MVTVCLNELVVVKDLSILENILVLFVNVVRLSVYGLGWGGAESLIFSLKTS